MNPCWPPGLAHRTDTYKPSSQERPKNKHAPRPVHFKNRRRLEIAIMDEL